MLMKRAIMKPERAILPLVSAIKSGTVQFPILIAQLKLVNGRKHKETPDHRGFSAFFFSMNFTKRNVRAGTTKFGSRNCMKKDSVSVR